MPVTGRLDARKRAEVGGLVGGLLVVGVSAVRLRTEPRRLDVVNFSGAKKWDGLHVHDRPRHEDLRQTHLARGRRELRALDAVMFCQQHEALTLLRIGQRDDGVSRFRIRLVGEILDAS